MVETVACEVARHGFKSSSMCKGPRWALIRGFEVGVAELRCPRRHYNPHHPLKLLPQLFVVAGLDSPDIAATRTLGGTASQWIITISIIGSNITGSNVTLQQILAQALHTFTSLMPE